MKTIDIIILIFMFWGAYKGFTKGLLMQVITTLAFILAIILGFKLMDIALRYLRECIDLNDSIGPFMAFIIVFMLVIIGITFLGKAMKKIINLTLVGMIDNVGGAVFGMFIWSLAVSVVFFLMKNANINLPVSSTEGSVFYPIFVEYGPSIIDGFASILPITKGLFESVSSNLQGCDIAY